MDYEDFYIKFVAAFKVQFTIELAKTNTKRNDNLPDMGHWLEESLDDTAKSYEYFGFFFTANSTGVPNGRAIAVNYEMEIDLFIPDNQDGEIQTKLKRYNQVLRSTSQAVWAKVGAGISAPTISFLTPINATLNNSSKVYKLLGIQVSFTMVFN